MLPVAIVVAALTAATPTPQTPEPPPPPPAVRLTIGVSGDLLPHLPIVARARALARGRGYDFRPLLRPIRRWVRRNSLAFCHVETPLTPAAPAGYPRFSSPPALARAVKATGFDACSTASNHSLDRGQAGIGATRRALTRAGVRHTGSFSSRRQQRRPLLLRARGVKVALLSYTQMTNGIPLPHPWSVNLAARRTDPARRQAGTPRRRARRDRQPALGHRVPARAGRVPDRARPAAGPLARDHRGGRPARPCRAADPARRPALGRVRRGQPALDPDRRMLPRREPGRHARSPSPPRRPRGARVERITYTPTWVRHPDYTVVRARHAQRASWHRTVAVVGRSRRVQPRP